MILIRRISSLITRSHLNTALVAATLIVTGAMATACNEKPVERNTQTSKATPTAHTHSTAGETCFICDPSKRDPGRLWCKEHGRYEDRCWDCQPQLRDSKRVYCEEHGLYEDECFLCDPSRAAKKTTTGKRPGTGERP
jgi:hypothetical protein